ncbi:unnamed protein product [Diamesa tonsa]
MDKFSFTSGDIGEDSPKSRGNRNKKPINLSKITAMSPVTPSRRQSLFNSPKQTGCGKDYGIFQHIDTIRDTIIQKMEVSDVLHVTGVDYCHKMTIAKELAHSKGEIYSPEIKKLCTQFKTLERMMEVVRGTILKNIDTAESRYSILMNTSSTPDSEILMTCLLQIRKFLKVLLINFEDELKIKKRVIENIGHTRNTEEASEYLMTWICRKNLNYQLILQLKTSPPDTQWIV